MPKKTKEECLKNQHNYCEKYGLVMIVPRDGICDICGKDITRKKQAKFATTYITNCTRCGRRF